MKNLRNRQTSSRETSTDDKCLRPAFCGQTTLLPFDKVKIIRGRAVIVEPLQKQCFWVTVGWCFCGMHQWSSGVFFKLLQLTVLASLSDTIVFNLFRRNSHAN